MPAHGEAAWHAAHDAPAPCHGSLCPVMAVLTPDPHTLDLFDTSRDEEVAVTFPASSDVPTSTFTHSTPLEVTYKHEAYFYA